VPINGLKPKREHHLEDTVSATEGRVPAIGNFPLSDWHGGIAWDRFFSNKWWPGGVELVVANLSAKDRISELLGNWPFLCLEDGTHPYPQVLIITPGEETTKVLIDGAISAIKRLHHLEPPLKVVRTLVGALQVANVQASDSASLITTVSDSIDNTLIVVIQGMAYAEAMNAVAHATGANTNGLAALAAELSRIVADSTGLVIVDAGAAWFSFDAENELMKGLAHLDNVGIEVSKFVGLGEANEDLLESKWLSTWLSSDTTAESILREELSRRFGWPKPYSRIVFESIIMMDDLERDMGPASFIKLPEAMDLLAGGVKAIFHESQDYGEQAALIRATHPGWIPLFDLCLAAVAAKRGLDLDVLALAQPSSLGSECGEVAVNLLLASMEKVILAKEMTDDTLHSLHEGTGELLIYLATHPNNTGLRTRLSSTLSPARSGFVGLAILTKKLEELVGADITLRDDDDPFVVPATNDELMEFMSAACPMIECSGSAEGIGQILPELMRPSADSLLETVILSLEEGQTLSSEEFDERTLDWLCSIGVRLAASSTDPDMDLSIFRAWGAGLAQLGVYQRSRDVAETLLQHASGSLERNRLGWSAFADIYHRGRNYFEALLGLCCAFSVHPDRTAHEAIRELSDVVRLLRDLKSWDLADKCCQKLIDLVRNAKLSEKQTNRVELLTLTMRMARINDDGADATVVSALIDDVANHLERAKVLMDTQLPAAVLLGQLLQKAASMPVAIPSKVEEIIARARQSMDGNYAKMFDVVCSEEFKAEDLLEFVQIHDRPRFGVDLGYDTGPISLGARRLLASSSAESDARAALFASELLSDLGITRFDEEQGTESWFPHSVEAPSLAACELSERGVDIVLLAINSSRRLVVTLVQHGSPTFVRELPNSEFSIEAFDRWSASYPFCYGALADEICAGGAERIRSLFLATMEGLGAGFEIERPTIFVTEPALQAIPPNLFLTPHGFFGERAPVASAPSLQWLLRAANCPNRPYGPPVAWISDSGGTACWTAPLNVLAGRVEGTLEDHSIPFIRSSGPPPELRNAELAIVGAHGGLTVSDRFFRVLSDESDERIAPGMMADSLAGAKVVILFVCSGGRVDSHPFSQAGLGLPRQLLEAGVEVVLGSPWPLDVRVADYWLPAFLNAWNAGESVLTCNFKANAVVAKRTGSPDFALAMTTYGNPFARRWTG
jgi:hypothetical protein